MAIKLCAWTRISILPIAETVNVSSLLTGSSEGLNLPDEKRWLDDSTPLSFILKKRRGKTSKEKRTIQGKIARLWQILLLSPGQR